MKVILDSHTWSTRALTWVLRPDCRAPNLNLRSFLTSQPSDSRCPNKDLKLFSSGTQTQMRTKAVYFVIDRYRTRSHVGIGPFKNRECETRADAHCGCQGVV